MNRLKFFLSVFLFLLATGNLYAQDKNLIVRIAKLTIDSTQLKAYNTALKLHAETAIKAEPGVLNLYALYEKANPSRVTVFEIYANNEAYQSHLKTVHFLKYKSTTKDMVKSLELVESVPIALETKYKN